MRAGNLDRRALLEAPTNAVGAYGELTHGYVSFATVAADLSPSSGQEAARLGTLLTSTPYTVRMRYRSDVSSKTRITIEGKVLQVRSIMEIGRRAGLALVCEEVK